MYVCIWVVLEQGWGELEIYRETWEANTILILPLWQLQHYNHCAVYRPKEETVVA